MQRDPRRTSLGAALFDFPPASGYRKPTDQAPVDWLAALLAKHSDAALYSGLFTACRSGRDWVLGTAPQVTLRLFITAASQPEPFARQLAAIAQILSLRQGQPVTLSVFISSDTSQALKCLESVPLWQGLGVSELELTHKTTFILRSNTTRQFFYRAGKVFAGLVGIDAPCCVLPGPDRLPLVKHLGIRCPTGREPTAAETYRSVSQLCPQLTSLAVLPSISAATATAAATATVATAAGQSTATAAAGAAASAAQAALPAPDAEPAWSQIFTPLTPASNLTHFTTECILTDELVSLLVSHAPALKHVGVSGVRLTLCSRLAV